MKKGSESLKKLSTKLSKSPDKLNISKDADPDKTDDEISEVMDIQDINRNSMITNPDQQYNGLVDDNTDGNCK